MNVFLISRTDPVGPDEYVAAVVVAPDERRARDEAVHLTAHGEQGTDRFLSPDTATCEYVGVGRGPVRVVLESFNPA